MLVLKFGGTSVGSPEALEKIIEILNDSSHREKAAVMVVSAFSGVTDTLIDLSSQAASGNMKYIEAVEGMKKRHLDTALYFLAGKALEEARAKLDREFSELLRVLDGISILRELSQRSLDLVMSFGERLSASLVTSCVRTMFCWAR